MTAHRLLLGLLLMALVSRLEPMLVEAHEADASTCQVTLELVDADSGDKLPGVVAIADAAGRPIAAESLLPRGLGVGDEYAIHRWQLLPVGRTVSLPRQPVTIQAFSGLTTELGEARVDLSGKQSARVQIALKSFYDPRANGLQSGNTHVHLQKIGRQQSERYLLEVARAEQLDMIYISYLERAEADLQYTTNKYSQADLRRLTASSLPHGGAEFDNGQEHRHNFAGFGEGYGHVMFLHLAELVRPVSIGPGIMKQGIDYPPLRPGIDNARRQGAAVIWCHNKWGLEDVPSWIDGRLHANNIFDGGTHGSYRHSFYRYLNAGIDVPFSTGTDWFIYDFSRVYVRAKPSELDGERRLRSAQWLERLAEGRSLITNGPLLELEVEGAGPGETARVAEPRAVKLAARGVGRIDFQRIELVVNGRVVRSQATRREGGHFVAELSEPLAVDGPCWIALRTPPPSTRLDADLQRQTPLNEYGRELFSHTSSVHLEVAGRRHFDPSAAQSLIDEMEEALEAVDERAKTETPEQLQQIKRIYREAIATLKSRL